MSVKSIATGTQGANTDEYWKVTPMADGTSSEEELGNYGNTTPAQPDSFMEQYKQLAAQKDSEPILSKIYQSTVPKPAEISEQGIQAARTASSIGDSLGVLAQMAGAGAGAHIKPDQGATSTEKQIGLEKDTRNLYQQRLDQYNQGLFSAQAHDAQMKAQNDAANRKMLLESLITKYKTDQQSAKQQQDFMIELQKLGFTQAEIKEKMRSNKAKEKIEQQRANTYDKTGAKYSNSDAGMTPEEIADANDRFSQIPVEWAGQHGLTKLVDVKGDYKTTSQPTMNMAIRPSVQKVWADKYESEKAAPKPYQPKPGEFKGADGNYYKRVPVSQASQEQTYKLNGVTSR